MYTDGQIITKAEYKAFANWNNANGNKFEIFANGNGTYKIVEIVVPEPTIEEKNEAIRQTRANLYAELIDPLHSQKQRKTVLGEWTEELEAEYVEQVKTLTAKIQEENPYVELTVDNGTIYVQDIVYTKDYINGKTRTKYRCGNIPIALQMVFNYTYNK